MTAGSWKLGDFWIFFPNKICWFYQPTAANDLYWVSEVIGFSLNFNIFGSITCCLYLSATPKGDDGIWKDYAYVLSTDVIDFS